jgi:23S rRNA (guanine745-N1)-methyltransferase
MTITPARNFACPIDGLPLTSQPVQPRRCANGHSFDVAREGYCNLLVVQHKASLDPGDTAAMVEARRRLLETGIYTPIADGVFDHIRALIAGSASPEPLRVVDAGCGEGFYLARIAELAHRFAPPVGLELAGTDVSKWAVRAAAKRRLPVAWAVANNRHLPFMARTVDLILCLFGFPVWQGFQPVLAASGRVLLVDPGPDHLAELRAVIYPVVNRTPVAALDHATAAGFVLETTTPLTYTATLTSQAQIANLLAMTPHAYRAPDAGRLALRALDQLTVTIDVQLRQLRAPPEHTSVLTSA